MHPLTTSAYNTIMKISKKTLSIILFVLAGICVLAAVILLVKGRIEDRRMEEALDELRPTQSAETTQAPSTVEGEPTVTASPEPSTEETPASTEEFERVANPYADSFLANKDMAAWLQIPGTNIDYPVMWTPEDETYYLYRAFDGSENKNGCLLLDDESCVDPLTTNLIIHGHNMKSGAMFGNLTDYENQDFYKEHKNITSIPKSVSAIMRSLPSFAPRSTGKQIRYLSSTNFSRRIRRKNLMTFITISSSYPSMTPVSPQSSEIIF